MAVDETRLCRPAVVKTTLVLIALCIAGYIVGPPLYWHIKEGSSSTSPSSSSSSISLTSSSLLSTTTSSNCAPCTCNCDSQPILTIPQELSNISFTDCAKHDPAVSGDTEKNFVELLSEELKLREASAAEDRRRADMALLEAKKVTSQYQKEADKCNSGMETCEEAREKAEAALVAQKKLTALWEQRARHKGWKDGQTKARTHSQGSVESE
ncbi:uncharacterized protein LOC141647737 [Silene latifolia]|uniref:uncharacterized protein LOC141647737 n=1 Tax=Silene latifolia TaxID=37657 RepID=UPI003D77EB79